MNEVKKMIGKALTTTVVATTIAWSIGLSALVAPLSAAAVSSGTLVKASLPAVYYVGGDMKRYVFPNEKTYMTWYSDFSQVQVITDAELASMPIGGNVTYKPGIKMVKITTDPKVYAVDAHGTLRWVSSEAVAVALYGANWNQHIDDVSDAFFVNYTIGSDITAAGQFLPATVVAGTSSINADKGISTGGVVTGQLSAMLSSGQPVGGNLPLNATGVNMVKIDLKNSGSSAMTVDSLTVRRNGLGVSTDFTSVYVYEGNNRLTTGRTINGSTNEATFSGLNLSLAAGETKVVWIAADIAGTTVGNYNSLQIVNVSAGTVVAAGLPLSGPLFSWSGAAVGGVTIAKNGTISNPKAGNTGVKVAEFQVSETAGTEDIMINRIALYYAGTVNRSDITNLVLKQAGLSISSVAGLNAKDQAVFALTSPFTIEKGNSRIFEVYGDIAGTIRANESIKFFLDQAADLSAVGKTYGYGVGVTFTAYDNSAANGTDASWSTVEAGQLTISFNGPASKDVAAGSKDVELYSFTLAPQANLEVRKTVLVAALGSGTWANYTDVKIVDVATGATVAGPMTLAATMNFTEVYNLMAGQAKTFKVTADIDRLAANNDTVKLTLNAFGATDIRNLDNSTYVTDFVPSAAVVGNQHTVKTPSLAFAVASTPVAQTFIQGGQGIGVLGVSMTAGTGGDVKVNSIKVSGFVDADTATNADVLKGCDIDGAVDTKYMTDIVLTGSLWDGATQVGATKSPSSSTAACAANDGGEMTFDNLNLTIAKGTTKTLNLKVNLNTSIATLNDKVRFDVTAAGDVSTTDADGNAITPTGFAVTGPLHTISGTGTLSVALAPDDTESEAGHVISGASNVVLAKYKWTAQNEELRVSKMQVAVANAIAVSSVSIYDGATLVAGPASISGAGTVDFNDISFIVAKDASKVMTIKANLTTVGAAGATTGTDAKVTINGAATFEARGTASGSSTVIAAAAVTGSGLPLAANSKLVRKSKPSVSLVALPTSVLSTGDISVVRFTIAADAAGDVALKGFAVGVSSNSTAILTIAKSGATSSARRVGDGTDVAGSSAVSGTCAAVANSCQLNVLFTNEEVIAAGTSRSYDVRVNVTGTLTSGDSLRAGLFGDAVSQTGVITAAGSVLSVAAGADNFVWSDISLVPHSDVPGASSADWINGAYVKVLPTDTNTLSK